MLMHSVAAAPSALRSVLDLAAEVGEARRAATDLLPALEEPALVYQGLSSDECERLRGVCLSALEQAKWSDQFAGIVIEELTTSYHPATLAGAARALRGWEDPPAWILDVIAEAFHRCIEFDRRIDPGRFEVAGNYPSARTVSQELAVTFCFVSRLSPAPRVLLEKLRLSARRLKPSLAKDIDEVFDDVKTADMGPPPCCEAPAIEAQEDGETYIPLTAETQQFEVETQAGQRLTFGGLLGSKPSLLTFFYTRCMNPLKCSSTITKLAKLQKKLERHGYLDHVNLFAMTYDPAYDAPIKLRQYGKDRGIIFRSTCSLFRMPDASEQLFETLQVLVGYGASTVNRHGLNAFVIDRNATIVCAYKRTPFDIDHAFEELMKATQEDGV